MLIAPFIEWRKAEKAFLLGKKIKCPDCDGEGSSGHHCDCEHCETDQECDSCEGQCHIIYSGDEEIPELSAKTYFRSLFSSLRMYAVHTGEDFLGLAGVAIKQEGHP